MEFSNRDIINKLKQQIRRKHKGGMFRFGDLQDEESDSDSDSEKVSATINDDVHVDDPVVPEQQGDVPEQQDDGDDQGEWNDIVRDRRVTKKRTYFEGYNNPNSDDNYYTFEDFNRWYSRRKNPNTRRNYTADEIQDLWDNKSYTKGNRADTLRSSANDCEKNFVYSKRCNKISKCCDTSQNRLCHFKDDVIASYNTVATEMRDTGSTADQVCSQERMSEVPYCKMSRDHDEYKALEKADITINNSYRDASSLTPENRTKLYEAVAKRQLWLNNYYRAECRTCDGDCKNHQGRITSGETALNKGGKSRKRHRKRRTKRSKRKKRRSKKKYNKHKKTLRKNN